MKARQDQIFQQLAADTAGADNEQFGAAHGGERRRAENALERGRVLRHDAILDAIEVWREFTTGSYQRQPEPAGSPIFCRWQLRKRMSDARVCPFGTLAIA